MNIVLDTNVLVSGLLSPYGPPAKIVGLVATGKIVLSYDARILIEYREALSRPRFGFDQGHLDTLLSQIISEGLRVSPVPLSKSLPDENDEAFLEVACSPSVKFLVTGYLKHFPKRSRQGVAVVSPRDFIEKYQG